MRGKFRFKLSTTQIIMLSFLVAILVGSALLALPVSAADGIAVPYIDALFTAASSICVTGLMTIPLAGTWSLFGQVVILMLIQIGGLGVITVVSGVMVGFHRKIGISDRLLIQDAFNLNTMSGVVRFVKRVLIGTILIEGIGAVFYAMVFVPEYGAKGIWFSVFNSVSAFCNAGMDIMSGNSLCAYVRNPLVNIVTCLLVVLGSIGFVVWWDVLQLLRNFRKQGLKCFRGLTLHSKIAIVSTVCLIVVGAVATFVFEYQNPLTLQGYSLIDKIGISLFQSITARTAGFVTIPQQNLTNASTMVSMLLMFIGGSPIGTGGGIKTVTFVVLLVSVFATMRNKREVSLFHRTVSEQAISKAVAVVSMFFAIIFIAVVLLAAITDAELFDIIYEVVSAATTVGFSRNLTPTLNVWGKLIMLLTLYFGRVGPISLVLAFGRRGENTNIIKNPVEEISVG